MTSATIDSVAATDALYQRVVVYAPTPQDARLCEQILRSNRIAVTSQVSIESVTAAIDEGAGLLLIAQEHLDDEALKRLRATLEKQPRWSELPIVVLLQSEEVGTQALRKIFSLGHVTLINRPLRIAVFLSSIQAKLRDRRRQIEVRDLLLEKDRTSFKLRREARRIDMAIAAGGMAPWEWTHEDVFWSDALRRLYGFGDTVKPTEQAMLSVVAEADRETLRNQWARCVADDRSFRSEFRIVHPASGERWIAAVAEPVRSKSGKTLRYAGLQWDITDRKRSVESLRQRERYFREIADASPAMLWVTDENHRCTFLSKSWYETTGQSEAEGLGLGWTNITHPDDRERVTEEFVAVANARESFQTEYRLRMADGTYRWAVDVGYPRWSGGGDFLGYTGYVIDVNERKIFEQSLERAKLVAEDANRSRGEFLANMSHEIRTPMAAILGHTDILKDHLKDPDNLQVVETIRRNGNFLLSIINDILDLSKIDSGKLEIEKRRVRPDGLLAEVRSLMDVRASEKQLPLKIEFDGPIPEMVETDAVRLRQILLNLVGNAIKFTDEGEVKVVVRYVGPPRSQRPTASGPAPAANANATSSWLVFEIIDTGVGIKPEHQSSLFEPFVQADATSTRSFGGTGLGLAISRRLAEALGGDVSFSSEYGKGSKFTLRIAASAFGPLVEPNLSFDISAEQPTDVPCIQANVLVVDDRRDIRFLAQHFIEKASCVVVTATNGREAIAMIETNPDIDLIVMDMQMPVMDGYDAAAELRRRGCQLPIIALTANAMKSDRDECLAAGCTDYATKPLDSKQLIAMIARLVNADA